MMLESLACSAARGLDCRPDPRWCHRHVEMLDPERRKRVEHRVNHAWRGRDRSAFADALHADRVGGRGRLLKQRSYAGDMLGARDRIIEQRTRHQLSGVGVVAYFL